MATLLAPAQVPSAWSATEWTRSGPDERGCSDARAPPAEDFSHTASVRRPCDPLACEASASASTSGSSPQSSDPASPSKGGSSRAAWGLSGSLAVRLGSGLSATAVGVHLAAYVSPWLPSLDLSLLLRLDSAFLGPASPTSPSPMAAASAAGLLGSSLAAAEAMGGRLPLLCMLFIGTALILLSFLGSPSSLLGLPLLAARSSLRHLPVALWQRTRPFFCHLAFQGARTCAKAAAKAAVAAASPAAPSSFPASSAPSVLQALVYWLSTARALLASLLSPALISLLLLPLAPAKGLQSGHKGSESQYTGNASLGSGCSKRGSRVVGGSLDEEEQQGAEDGGSRTQTPASSSSRAYRSSSQGAEPDGAWGQSGACRHGQRGGAEAGAGRGDEAGAGSCQAVGEAELEELLSRLEVEGEAAEGPWEMIVDKASSSVDYCAWRRDPQDGGPTEYKSWTRFYGCTAQRLCAFYLDCEHLQSWEAMVKSYASLELDAGTGHQVGRMVKKYPLCSPREYVLGWRVWRGPSDGPTATYYCVTQAVEHQAAPRTQSLRRVDAYKCSWRIREVHVEGVGWSAEVDMFVQEDSGMQRAMAKLAFRRSIWGYVQTSNAQLRNYPACLASDAAAPRDLACWLPACVERASLVPQDLSDRYVSSPWDVSCDTPRDGLLSAALSSGESQELSGDGAPLGALPALRPARGYRSFLRASSGRPTGAASRRPEADGGWGLNIRRRAIPVLAAAAGLGTITVARGPVGFAAKILVACAVRILSSSQTESANRQLLKSRRGRWSRSRSSNEVVLRGPSYK